MKESVWMLNTRQDGKAVQPVVVGDTPEDCWKHIPEGEPQTKYSATEYRVPKGKNKEYMRRFLIRLYDKEVRNEIVQLVQEG